MMDTEGVVVGVGSPQGEDRAGWLVVDRLRELGLKSAVAIGDVSQLTLLVRDRRWAVVIDACQSESAIEPGTIRRLRWPDHLHGAASQTTTHDIDVPSALKLAEQLGVLPANVIVYGIEISANSPDDSISDSVASAIEVLAQRIYREWTHSILAD